MSDTLIVKNIFVLTGAGVSAESGVKTFRDAKGLWENHRIEEVATPEGFLKNPTLVHEFYNQRRKQLSTVEPNAAHLALADFEKKWTAQKGNRFLLVTQNVDDLHERAGSFNLLHMHGELRKVWCRACGQRWRYLEDLDVNSVCPGCGNKGKLRPDIVWFGEMPYCMDEIEEALMDCDLFLAVGTSGQVYPAAGFVSMVPEHCHKVEVNADVTAISNRFNRSLHGLAGEKLPEFLSSLL